MIEPVVLNEHVDLKPVVASRVNVALDATLEARQH
jgi:hypothetical protein